MRSGLTLVTRFVLSGALSCVLFWLWPPQGTTQTGPLAGDSAPSAATASHERDPLLDAGSDHFYNMDYDRAVQDFEKLLARQSNEPSAVNHLLATILMRELYRMGAMNSGEYANDSFIGNAHRIADPKAKERINQLVDRAEGLEEQELKSNPNDVDALYARGATRAQFSLY